MQLSKETANELEKGEKLSRLAKSDDWAEAKKILNDLVLQYSDILSIEQSDPNLVMQEVASRQIAIQMVREWVQMVEGSATAHELNKQAAENMSKNDIYLRFGDQE